MNRRSDMMPQPHPPLASYQAQDLIAAAFEGREASALLGQLSSHPADYFLVGGAVRDLIRGQSLPRDLDLIVPNGDTRAHEILSNYGSAKRNRHGNWRYSLGPGRHVDVIEPRFFYRHFDTAEETLKFFDASVNAIGLRLHDGGMLNPIDGLGDLLAGEVTLPEDRWTSMNEFESVHLIIRLCRLLSRLSLHVMNPEIATAHLHKFDRVDWSDLQRLNGVSRRQAQEDVAKFLA